MKTKNKTYTVYELKTENGLYIGVTTNLKRRLAEHRSKKSNGNHVYISYAIHGVFDDKDTAYKLEDSLIQTTTDCINIYNSGLQRTEDANGYMRELLKNNSEYRKRQYVYRQNWYNKHKTLPNFKVNIERKREYDRNKQRNLYEGESMMFGKTHMRIYRIMFR